MATRKPFSVPCSASTETFVLFILKDGKKFALLSLFIYKFYRNQGSKTTKYEIRSSNKTSCNT